MKTLELMVKEREWKMMWKTNKKKVMQEMRRKMVIMMRLKYKKQKRKGKERRK